MSEPIADRDPFELVAESFLERFRAGERPGVEEYVARHPEMAEQLRELLPALVMVEQDLTIDHDPCPDEVRSFHGPRRPGKERRLGDYRILREIGRGGMGVVYEAEQVSLGRHVALKVLPGHVMGDRKTRERFRREAKAAARLHHTNIVPVFEVGRDGEVRFYAMQLIQGQGLDQVIDELARLFESARESCSRPRASEQPASLDPIPADASTALRRRALGQMAGSLLCGRLAIEGPEPYSSGGLAATDLVATERFGTEASSDRTAPVVSGDHPSAVLASNT